MATFTSSTSKQSTKAKASRAGGAAALSIARQKGDPLVEKMLKAKQLYTELKSQLMRKYANAGKQAVVQSASNKSKK